MAKGWLALLVGVLMPTPVFSASEDDESHYDFILSATCLNTEFSHQRMRIVAHRLNFDELEEAELPNWVPVYSVIDARSWILPVSPEIDDTMVLTTGEYYDANLEIDDFCIVVFIDASALFIENAIQRVMDFASVDELSLEEKRVEIFRSERGSPTFAALFGKLDRARLGAGVFFSGYTQ